MSKRRTTEEPILCPLGPFPLLLVFFPLPIPLRLLITHFFPSLFTAHSFHTCLVLPVGELPGQGHRKIQTGTHSSEGHTDLLHPQKLPLGSCKSSTNLGRVQSEIWCNFICLSHILTATNLKEVILYKHSIVLLSG